MNKSWKALVDVLLLSLPAIAGFTADYLSKQFMLSDSQSVVAIGTILAAIPALMRKSSRKVWTAEERVEKLGERRVQKLQEEE